MEAIPRLCRLLVVHTGTSNYSSHVNASGGEIIYTFYLSTSRLLIPHCKKYYVTSKSPVLKI